MFDPMDHLPAGDVARRRPGRYTVDRVKWIAYRWVMIQFAKYVAVECLNSTKTIEEIVDAWLRERPA